MTGVKQVSLVEAPEPNLPAVQPVGSDLVGMFERLARDPSVDVEKLERLIAMQERIMRHNAEAQFNTAFSEMLPEVPTIIERVKADKTLYAPLEDIVEPLRPILARHGFSVSFRTEWPDAKTVKVVGILTHRAGHARNSEFMSAADATGSKNAIQALGSAVAYGKRYTFKDLLCIVTRGEDDDAKRAGKPDLTDPDGFDVFLDVLATASMNGTRALTAEFNKAAQPLRTHLTAQYAGKWASYKKVASDADARTAKAGAK